MTAALVNNYCNFDQQPQAKIAYWSSSRNSFVLFRETEMILRMPLGFRIQMTQRTSVS